MSRRNVVITEEELILIRLTIKDWLRLDEYDQLGNAELRHEILQLLKSLPLPDHEMEIEMETED